MPLPTYQFWVPRPTGGRAVVKDDETPTSLYFPPTDDLEEAVALYREQFPRHNAAWPMPIAVTVR